MGDVTTFVPIQLSHLSAAVGLDTVLALTEDLALVSNAVNLQMWFRIHVFGGVGVEGACLPV